MTSGKLKLFDGKQNSLAELVAGRSYYRPVGVEHNVIQRQRLRVRLRRGGVQDAGVTAAHRPRRLVSGENPPNLRAMSERRKKKKPGLPTKQQVLEFIRESPTPVGKREIAARLRHSGGDRIALKQC